MTKGNKEKSKTLVKERVIDGERLICVAPWYWVEIHKTMEFLTKEIDLLEKRLGITGDTLSEKDRETLEKLANLLDERKADNDKN